LGKLTKLNIPTANNNKKNPNNHTIKPLTYEQTSTDKTKPGLEDFNVIWSENGSDQFYSY